MNMGIALGKDGKLFTWGYGNHLNEVIRKDEPTQLHLPNIGAIVKLEPGKANCLDLILNSFDSRYQHGYRHH